MFDGPIAQSGPRPRLFYQPSKIKYDRKHYWWRLPNGRLADGMSDSCKVIEGIKITHDKSLRLNGDYNLAVLKYQHWLLEHESQYVRTGSRSDLVPLVFWQVQIFELSSQLTTSLKVTKFGYIEEVTRGAVPA